MRPEFGENLRSFAVQNYAIFYVTVPEGINVVRVLHGRRDIQIADVT
jgi:toxin ParE1/3/4